jgi:hypothetical protein
MVAAISGYGMLKIHYGATAWEGSVAFNTKPSANSPI